MFYIQLSIQEEVCFLADFFDIIIFTIVVYDIQFVESINTDTMYCVVSDLDIQKHIFL